MHLDYSAYHVSNKNKRQQLRIQIHMQPIPQHICSTKNEDALETSRTDLESIESMLR